MKKLFSLVLVVVLAATMVLGTAAAETTLYSESYAAGAESGTTIPVDGYTFTEENIELRITIATQDAEHAEWGFGAINDSAWANISGLDLKTVAEPGENVTVWTLKEIGDAFAAAGSDPTAGLIINVWDTYGLVTKVEIVDTTAAAGGEGDDSAQTGDMMNVALLAGVAALAFVAVVASKKANA